MNYQKGVPEWHKLFVAGTKYHQEGQLSSALECYQKILRKFPRHADALHLAGIILADQGKLQEGLNYINRAILARSDFPPYYLNRGLLYKRLQQFPEALSDFKKTLVVGGPNAQVYCNIGETLMAADVAGNNFKEAIAAYKTALQLDSHHITARHNLGNVYLAMGDKDNAVICYQEVLSEKPDLPETLTNLGVVLIEQDKIEDGISYHQKALKINPRFAKAYINLGLAYNRAYQFAEATAAYERALSLEPSNAEIYSNLGVCYKDQNNVERALQFFRQAQTIKHSAEAEFNEAISLLLLGDFANGWPKYEARLHIKERANDLIYPQPRWQGEDLGDKKLLIHVEQGLGDTIQFCRYLNFFKDNDNVVFTCQEELISLLKPFFSNIVPRGRVNEDFDYQIPIMSLPLIFHTMLETIPFSTGYLQAPTNHKLAGLLNSTKPKVGIVWAGNKQHKNDHNRSIPLDLFKELFELDNIAFYSLQWGERVSEIKVLGLTEKLFDTSVYIKDFCDTAAIISQLDLLITIDTAIVHLAGALAKPTWLLLPFAPDFRWLLERADSPWYQSIKIFRQHNAGNWQDVIRDVKMAVPGFGIWDS